MLSIKAEIMGRQALGAWNARLRRRALAAAAARPDAAERLAAETVELLAAARGESTGASSGGVLIMWGAGPALVRPFLEAAAAPIAAAAAAAAVVVVEPSADGAEDIAAALGLAGPQRGAHDGWERYLALPSAPSPAAAAAAAAGPSAQVYRGSPFALTPPVLSLAHSFEAAVDVWGLAVAPPRLRLAYLRALAELLPAAPRGALVLAAAVKPTGADDSGSGSNDSSSGGSNDELQPLTEAELAALVAAAEARAGLRLAARAALPAEAQLELGPGGAAINALLLFERC